MKSLQRMKRLSIVILSILLPLALVGCGEPSALIVYSVTGGNVFVCKAGTTDWIEAEVGMSLEEGDIIKSGYDSNAEITCIDGSTIELQYGTEIEIVSIAITDTSSTIVLRQIIGSIIFRVIKIIDAASRYEVLTQAGAVVARGSAMQVSVAEDGTTQACNLEGDIWAIAQGVELQIPEGQCCIIRPGQPPELIDALSEWTRAPTPTTADWVLAPESVIIDLALASVGDVVYAIVYGYDEEWSNEGYRLLKSSDGAATWEDMTDALDEVIDPYDEGYNYIDELVLAATDWQDPDFVAVAVWWWNNDATTYYLNVLFSTDGGETFGDAAQVEDSGVYFDGPDAIADLAVSFEVAGKRDIAIAGMDNNGMSALFRCTVTGDSATAWEDATVYDGWDNVNAPAEDIDSYFVTDLMFSSNWETDRTILAVTVVNLVGMAPEGYLYGAVYLQSGVWGATSAAWNEAAGFAQAVLVIQDVYIPYWLMDFDARLIAGMTLPLDYSGADTDTRLAWVWVNYYDDTVPMSQGEILRVRDDAVDSVNIQIEHMPWLTNVCYLGTIAEGKAIVGMLADSADYPLSDSDLIKECCEGTQVYRNHNIYNMDICCLPWDRACKPPTGLSAMAVSYVSEDKAYAVALGGELSYEEGAWSVSFDDGDTWNQLSLIDTYISYLSDVAVSPDCNKMFLVSANSDYGCGCDSAWVYADEFPEAGFSDYSGHWLRTWIGWLTYGWGFLRLAPEETFGDTVYLVDHDTDAIYYNDLETLACWERGTATMDEIVDLATADEATIYAVDYVGDVAVSDDHGKALSWTSAVASNVNYGHSIAVHGGYVLVGGQNGQVSYSSDGGQNFTLLGQTTPDAGFVTVAFDTYFDTNKTIYAAVDGDTTPTTGGIYLWVIDGSGNWTDLDAWHDVGYTGLVLSNAIGNPYTSPETGGVLYASFAGWDGSYGRTGVARCLAPICFDVGEAQWDYLTESDPGGLFYGYDSVGFQATPDALKICGCLSPVTNSKLFAIDSWRDYDLVAGEDGAVWTFEDWYAKKALSLISPADGATIPANPSTFLNLPFGLLWNRLCDAYYYDIQLAADSDFTLILTSVDHYLPSAIYAPSYLVAGGQFSCGVTYYWRVRAVEAESSQAIRSWWSDPRSFTVTEGG